MAKPERKVSNSKPVTQHALFPAVVALWFGALFGLGSLAVRPSLLEELVIKSRIDLLIPAAAPPLGMTARMTLALVLAALGAALGAAIARRIARPKQEARERKRTNLSTRDEGAGHGPAHAYGDASTRNPGPASEDAAVAATPGVLAGRRRSLAIEHDQEDFVPHDLAPLPGGAPQIFDIASAGLGDAPTEPIAAPEPGRYAKPAAGVGAAPAPGTVALDWVNAAPVLPPNPLADQPAPQPQVTLPASEDGRQVFGMAPPATPLPEQPRQIFGAPVTGDHVPREFVESQGFRTSVFETPEPSALFAARAAATPAAIPVAFTPPAESADPSPIAAWPQDAPAVQSATEPEPALPSPASLGIEDLSARLAESMRRRRAGRSAAAAPAVPEAAPVVPEAAAPAVPVFSIPPFAIPPFTVPAAEAIPAGLRPLDLSGFEQDDLAEQVSLLPPRRIAVPAEAALAAAFGQASEPAPAAATSAEDEPEAAGEPIVAEENYASLLGVTPSPASLRNPFVRVEEPEAEAAPAVIEPVVIFPGQSVPPPPIAQPAAIGGAEPTPFRRFDAPANAGQGQPVAANETASAMPPEEAEQALRSVLANLQRMSGAA